jgi:hypothetical protein
MRSLLCALGVMWSSCAHSPAPAASVDCGLAVAGVEAVLRPGGTLVLGDVHGTREIPRFAGAVACEAARRGPTVLGLEVPADPKLDAFLASDGGAQAKQAVLAGEFWQDPYQDGRRSVAVFELLDQVRRWRQQGLPLEVLFFDGVAHDGLTRDRVMADNVLAKQKVRPSATFVLMMGNLHARKTVGTPWGDKDYAWLSSMLPSSVVTLNVRAPLGTAWVCHSSKPEDCGPDFWPAGKGATGKPDLALGSNEGGAYDGWFDVEAATASPPAAQPERARRIDAEIAQVLKGPKVTFAVAMEAYERKDFAGCAAELRKLAAPTADELYSRACCLALAGRKDDAFSDLAAALAKGFADQKTLQSDPDLASLHGDARWPKP